MRHAVVEFGLVLEQVYKRRDVVRAPRSDRAAMFLLRNKRERKRGAWMMAMMNKCKIKIKIKMKTSRR